MLFTWVGKGCESNAENFDDYYRYAILSILFKPKREKMDEINPDA
jgi:hypothetical protein